MSDAGDITERPEPGDIDSMWNACMHRNHCRALRAEVARERARADMHADLGRRTAEALGLDPSDGRSDMPERVAALRAEVARLQAITGPSGKGLGELESINDGLIAENEALAEQAERSEAEAAALLNALWQLLDGSRHCGEMQWCGLDDLSPWERARAAIDAARAREATR